MSIYMVTWKTLVINGNNTEGSFFSEVEDDKTIEEWIDKRKEWMDFAEESAPNRQGGKVMITGVFKL